MNINKTIKSKQATFAVLSILLSVAAPVLAQTSATGQKGTVTQVELSRKDKVVANGGSCHKQGGPGARALQGGRGFGRHLAMHRRSMLSSLRGEYALSNDQCEKLLALKDQFLNQAQSKFVDLKSSKRKMRELLTEPAVDKGQVLSLQNEINGDISTINNLKVENKLQQLSVLTDAQKQQLRTNFLHRALQVGRG